MRKYLKVKDLEQILGRSPASIYKLTSMKAIPHRHVPGLGLVFLEEEIARWVDNAKGTRLEDIRED